MPKSKQEPIVLERSERLNLDPEMCDEDDRDNRRDGGRGGRKD